MGRQGALLSTGNFSPLLFDGFSSPNPQKNCLAKIRGKKSPLIKKSLALLLCSVVQSFSLKRSSSQTFFCFHCSQIQNTAIITLSPYWRRFWPATSRGALPFSTPLRITGLQKTINTKMKTQRNCMKSRWVNMFYHAKLLRRRKRKCLRKELSVYYGRKKKG